MGSLTLLFLLSCTLLSCDVILARRIVNFIAGGTEAPITDYPYMGFLSLTNDYRFFECGSSIISRRYVLTSAYCVSGMTSASLRIGSANKTGGGTVYHTSKFIIHPNYNDGRPYDYDVALVRLPKQMDLDGVNAKKIDLVDAGQSIPQGTVVTIPGWGRTTSSGPFSATLRVAQLSTLANDNCATVLRDSVSQRMFCASRPNTGPCRGDFGGPAVSDNRQIGIASYSYSCDQENGAGIFTNITNYEIILWIKQITRS